MRVEITPILTAADEETIAKRADIAQRFDNLGQIDAASGTVNGEKTAGWQATINGATFPLDGFAVEPDGDRILLSLVLAPDEISIGKRIAGRASVPTLAENRERRSAWGDGTQPDPREGIPGWDPSLAEQVARNAQAATA